VRASDVRLASFAPDGQSASISGISRERRRARATKRDPLRSRRHAPNTLARHARHTTTNLRNASRLLYRYGVPTDRPLLVTSDFGQSLYIGHWHGMFGPRCQDELGYLPWRSLVPLSQYDTCMRPAAVSLHADGRDPLDP